MQLFQICKKYFNFTSLIIFVFFISCAVNAHEIESLNTDNKVAQDSKITVESSTLTKAKGSKSKVRSLKRNSKKRAITKSRKSKKIKNKKNVKKIIRKRIIKKVYVIKQQPEKKEEIKNDNTPALNIDLEALSTVPDDYLIEVDLTADNCEKMLEDKCLRGDSFFQKPYFHHTLITIFKYKIVAEQYLENYKRDKIFLKIKDGEYVLDTKKGNKIFIAVKNGVIDKLLLIEGDLDLELKITSKCQYSDKLHAFHRLYETYETNEHNFYYSNDKNFRGLVEVDVYSEKYQPNILYSVFNLPNKEKRPIQDLNLCRVGGNVQAIEKDFTKSECNRKFKCTMKTLEKFGSQGILVKDMNISYFDYYEGDKIVTLNPDEIQGLLDEVNKMGREDKKFLKANCFNDKNIDLMSCSASEKCEDYLVVNACEVNYFFDKDKVKNK